MSCVVKERAIANVMFPCSVTGAACQAYAALVCALGICAGADDAMWVEMPSPLVKRQVRLSFCIRAAFPDFAGGCFCRRARRSFTTAIATCCC